MADKKREISRPLPKLEELDTQFFWEETKKKRLSYQVCNESNEVVFHPRLHSSRRVGGTLEWRTSAGKGEVYAFSIIRQSYHPFFKGLVPYVVAWIDLDEGFRLLSNIVCEEKNLLEIECGKRVELIWEEHPEFCIPLFKLL